MPDRSNLREEMFTLSHGVKGFGQWFLGPIHLGRTSCHWEHLAGASSVSGWQGTMRQWQVGSQNKDSFLVLIVPAMTHLPMFLKPLKIVPQLGKTFNAQIPLKDILFLNHNKIAFFFLFWPLLFHCSFLSLLPVPFVNVIQGLQMENSTKRQ